jgi:hypothetical protein
LSDVEQADCRVFAERIFGGLDNKILIPICKSDSLLDK